MNNVRVSVIIPMYNSSDTIIQCLESVLNQTYKPLEILIMDDGSQDESYQLVKKYIEENKLAEIVVLKRQNNQGPSVARNELIKLSKGEYIAFLDSDDKWNEEKLQMQIDILNNDQEVSLIATCVNENCNKKYKDVVEIKFNQLLFKNYFFTPTIIVKKSVIEDVGLFNSSKKYSEDFDLWLRIAKKYKCILINRSLVICGGGKPSFGYSGLSSKLKEMEMGELDNYYNLYRDREIGLLKFIIVSCYSYLKYLRRYIITKLRNKQVIIKQ